LIAIEVVSSIREPAYGFSEKGNMIEWEKIMPARKNPPPTPEAAVMRRYRNRNPDYKRRERLRKVARAEALQALARRYPRDFMDLYTAELKHAGLDYVPLERPCKCGKMIVRSNPYHRWPKACGRCDEKENLMGDHGGKPADDKNSSTGGGKHEKPSGTGVPVKK
jgi:hypothetical protein